MFGPTEWGRLDHDVKANMFPLNRDISEAPKENIGLIEKPVKFVNYLVNIMLSLNIKLQKLSLKSMFPTHSWFRLVMNTLIATMEIGFQVTISKSEVQMTSNLFSLV